MKYEPIHLKPYARPDHYFGETWEGYYPVLGQTRDSDTLTRSNYRVALARLLDAADGRVVSDGEPVVTDTRCNHFACGWVETIYVWAGDEETVRAADEILADLESYPVVCEHDWSTLETEEAAEYWAYMGIADRIAACARYDVSIFAARRAEVPSDPCGELVSYLADGC